ncbi:MAG TPA: hypothetical protein VK154_05670 [Chitinophagales bacterium]|nr:hypothetical protein [Chitinophagales bacterium]
MVNAQQTFRVKKYDPLVATSVLRLPQYIPTATNSDTANVLWLDSVPPIGTLLTLWNDKAIIINYSISIGAIYGNLSAIIGENEQKLFRQALKTRQKTILTIWQVMVGESVSKTYWPYQVKFKE